jgi:hypothetical protein
MVRRSFRKIRLLAWLATFTLLPAEAPGAQAPPDPVASAPQSTLRQADLRVAAVAYRLASSGGALCSESYPLTGMLFHHLAEYLPADRRLMIERHALDRGPGILSVLADSPAARAGLIAGDVLLKVNGQGFPPPSAIAAEKRRKTWRRAVEATEAQFEAELRRGPADILVLRDGREFTTRLEPLPGCIGRVRLARSTQTNAFANNGYVIMTTAMLDFLRSDDELALILGHEFAHNILRHPDMRDEDGILAGLGIKASAMWRREEAADRFGLRLAAAAGYDLEAAIPFWKRYLRKYDWFPQIFRSHPSLRARERIATEEIEAIRREAAVRATPSS